jgi:hypothetical protein
MNNKYRTTVGIALVMALAFSAPARTFPCLDCGATADACWASSAARFNSCNVDCFLRHTGTNPESLLALAACLSGCEAQWILRNAQCGASYLTCITRNISCEEGGVNDCPLLLDLDRNNFHLAGLDDAVLFDIDADGENEAIAWTQADQQDAFLCLDRNGNGRIDDGSELFGNHTPLRLIDSTAPNGYIALAELDAPSLGGTTDGFIDANDEVYGELCVWIDSNHNGISEAEELSSLAAAGVTRIGLSHSASRRTDQHGNELRYLGDAWIERNGKQKHTRTVDVFFVESGAQP